MPAHDTDTSASVRSDLARCPHFGDCGGCATQDIAYADQVGAKQRDLEALFAPYWEGPVSVLPSPVVWHYRNKVDFNFGLRHYPEPPPKDFVKETLLGFTRKGQWYNPIDIETCLIGPEGCDALLDSVRRWYRANDYRAFDSRSKQGFLRALLVREGKRTGERMVALFTSPGEFDRAGFVAAVQDAFPSESIHRGIFRRSARGAFAEEMELLHGDAHIHEAMHVPNGQSTRDLRFRISPFSFFQTNTLGAEVLYAEIREWVRRVAPEIVYDLYGGAGGIAFAVSDLVKLVRSVENEGSATADGLHNAALNEIDNVFFANETIRRYLHALSETGAIEPNSAVIIDPPRGGLTPKPIRRLLECLPERILYVSCKASVLAEELPAFLDAYRLDRLWGVDMFPHTPHVEVLASLARR